ncbi:MAG: TIGR03087 family PEP-CTERM/XrtA system glycosyltransferase [Sphingomonas sp.]|uniref:TIGR03087 family PEP-CTERM/XrtA system glycosyltransferase n=1 Tax=Sphingomonas sp. TaxID=28214 RepID=UPI0025F6E4DC|nr:TIGR03087 family PEP-CTERM/XrtA system glycosyltransferase [Sphingomonas sp.]MBY0283004.1 TIGR03087 family PEP-CTERM/XrtA system glycosyltransferase [Sphingomonas sp.]
MGDILFLAHRMPFPPDRGDKIRGFHMLKHLARGSRVHIVAFADDSNDLKRKSGLVPFTASRSIIFRSKPQWLAALQALLWRRPVSLTAFESRAFAEAVQSVMSRQAIDTVFVFSSQMAQYLPPAGRFRVIMDFCDMDSAKFAAYAQSARGPMRWMMQREANLLLQHDRGIAARAAASLFVSEAEADLFRNRARAERVHVVENGIDTAFFDPGAQFKRIESIAGSLIVFTGQMDYRPNIEAVRWFAETVFPHIRVKHPAARFAIVGRNPSDAVRALTKIPGVIVTGEVPDVRGWLAAAQVVVAPLQLARGVQNKVLEAMAMARPLVASAAAAEGIDHGDTIRVGTTVGEIADHITALIEDPAAAHALGLAARAQVLKRYGWSARLSALDPVLGRSFGSARSVSTAT